VAFEFGKIKKILVPIDGSDHSMRAAEYGVGIAKTLDAEATVLYVIDVVVIDQIAKVNQRESVEAELKQDGQRYINYVLGLTQKAGVKASSLLAIGHPFEQIINLAKSLEMDLIVMGTYGRRTTERILIGSVAERVIEYASCPVVVVK
jgi:nucleotide-binding universal stress UspA family protein